MTVNLTEKTMTENNNVEKPKIVIDEHLLFLDNLRKSGITNARAVNSFFQIEFGLDKHEARKVVEYWMQTFSERRA